VLVNTAIAVAADPVEMAVAFRLGVEAGRRAHLAGLGRERDAAEASSPLTGFLEKARSSLAGPALESS
jgi:thiazole synthase